MFRRSVWIAVLALMGIGFTAEAASAQFTINARAGLGVPTGDVSSADDSAIGVGANSGFDIGGGIGYMLGDRFELRANFDASLHGSDVVGGTAGPDIDVFHYIGGLGVQLTDPEQPFYVSLNAGAGALNFDVDGGDSFTYFAINAGAEVGYWVSPSVALFASPQGDIAFSDEAELGTDTAFVWPFTAGIKFKIG